MVEKERKEKKKEDEGEIVKRKETLVFHKDSIGNYVSRLSGGKSEGKIVLQHRKDNTSIIEGLEYITLLEEKERWCFCWILGLAYYPRIIEKEGGSFIGMENNKSRKLYPDVQTALNALRPKAENRYVLLILKETSEGKQW